MFPLFETIKIQNLRIQNPEFHLERIRNSRSTLWNNTKTNDFENLFNELELKELKELIPEQIYKLKVIYNSQSNQFTRTPYYKRNITSLKPVVADGLEYPLKYTDRRNIEHLLSDSLKDKEDKENSDIIIIKNGFVTDSSYANLVFAKNNELFTPKECLLKGTKRAKYLKEGQILEKSIRAEEIQLYDSVFLINSMLDIGEIQYFLT